LAAPVVRVRRGYEGPRRRLLVVDNEEADRELLSHVLSPLGFELRMAASGHDALDLIAAGWRPDAMFVDLAMPALMDGRRSGVRARSASRTPPVAIVSANAFDKRLDNDVGITP
jgi:CheY-like chemotaxis protein